MRNDGRHRGEGRRERERQDPVEIWQSFRHPMLRWCDVPGGDVFMQQRLAHPDDPYLLDIHAHVHRQLVWNAATSGDPFYGSSPPAGTLPALASGRVPLCRLATGDVLSISVDELTKNVMICGPTGAGKSNYLRVLLRAVMQAHRGLVIVFDRKGGELIDCQTLSAVGLPLLVLSHTELALALLQPPPGTPVPFFINTIVQVLAVLLHLFASRRLMGDTLAMLFARRRPQGTWPALSEWIAMIEAVRASSISRLGQYKEAVLWSLKSVFREIGPAIDYTSSSMLDDLMKLRGCVTILTNGLGVEAESVLASVMINYAFMSREGADPTTLEPLIFALDDALPLVHGAMSTEAEGGVHPIGQWAFMSRSRRMGLVCSAQNFGLVSHALKNNCDTVLVFGSYGRDAEELARFLDLTAEQAAALPVIRPGEVIAIARGTWPQAVRGSVPLVS